ncbi:MAG: acyl-[acyl-carrier-protein] thioesterase [Deferribacterales bacterium]
MFYSYQHNNDISDYGSDGTLRFDAVLKIFQEAAILHSASVGYPADSYMGQGNIWILNRIMIQPVFFPEFGRQLTVKTWSAGMDKFRGFRNYEITADGEVCVRGSSIWLYLDIVKKRPVRVTPEMIKNYESEDVPHMGSVIEKWDRKEADSFLSEKVIGLRPADFDINGHMNNIRYAEIVSTVSRHIDFTGKTIGMFYSHEIKPDTEEVVTKYSETENSKIFSIYDKDNLAFLCEIF